MTSCDVKRQLLAEHLACLDRLRLAEREHSEFLPASSDGVVLRSSQRIEAIKALSSAARARYAEHATHTAAEQPLNYFPLLASSIAVVGSFLDSFIGEAFGLVQGCLKTG